jgi:hypothetical protein
MFEDINYRQLDTRVLQHILSTNITSEMGLEKPLWIVDLEVRYSPNEALLLFMNTSNDGLFIKNKIKASSFIIKGGVSRTTLFSNASMPDWE